LVGVKGRSGGRRKGAGRRPLSVNIGRKFALRAGDLVQVSYTEADGTAQEYSATLNLERVTSGYRLVLETEVGWRATIDAQE
jgi:hypothetical protein